MAGLGPAIHDLRVPVLDGLLALDGVADVLEALVIDEALEPVAAREAVDQPFAMLPHPMREARRDADIEHAVAAIAHEIDPAAFHGRQG